MADAGAGRLQRALVAARDHDRRYLFGEAGLSARRSAETEPRPPAWSHSAPREAPGASIAGEILLTPKGTLGLRGPWFRSPPTRLPPPATP